jgi:hypothetical protein
MTTFETWEQAHHRAIQQQYRQYKKTADRIVSQDTYARYLFSCHQKTRKFSQITLCPVSGRNGKIA